MKLLMLSLPREVGRNAVFAFKGIIDPNISLVFSEAGNNVFVLGGCDFKAG